MGSGNAEGKGSKGENGAEGEGEERRGEEQVKLILHFSSYSYFKKKHFFLYYYFKILISLFTFKDTYRKSNGKSIWQTMS